MSTNIDGFYGCEIESEEDIQIIFANYGKTIKILRNNSKELHCIHVKCDHCGTVYTAINERCPSCGAPKQKIIYQ